jgi:uncharacterized protein YeaO (DUF488 family)
MKPLFVALGAVAALGVATRAVAGPAGNTGLSKHIGVQVTRTPARGELMTVRVKRVYADAEESDGFRLLVDRLWPRGVSKERAALDLWLKDVAPTPELRKWFDHKEERFAEFSSRYEQELSVNPAVDQLREIIRVNPVVTLVYGARSEKINGAVVLAEFVA